MRQENKKKKCKGMTTIPYTPEMVEEAQGTVVGLILMAFHAPRGVGVRKRAIQGQSFDQQLQHHKI
jgi:hypothetical protein